MIERQREQSVSAFELSKESTKFPHGKSATDINVCANIVRILIHICIYKYMYIFIGAHKYLDRI